MCFGGFGPFGNPSDVWASETGEHWTLVGTAPWNAASPDDIKYDFDALAIFGGRYGTRPSILTFGGGCNEIQRDIIAAAGLWMYLGAAVDRPGSREGTVVFTVPKGATPARVGQMLADEQLIGSSLVWRVHLKRRGG